MITAISHPIPIGDILTHGLCGNTFHYLALKWTLDYKEGRVVLAKEPIPIMVCSKCQSDNTSAAAVRVSELIYEQVITVHYRLRKETGSVHLQS